MGIKKTGWTFSYGLWEVQFTVQVQWAGLLKKVSYDSWEEKISKYVAGKPSVTFSQLFCELGFEDKDQTPVQQQRLGKIMKKLGWMKSRGRKGEARFAVFKPPDLKHFQFSL